MRQGLIFPPVVGEDIERNDGWDAKLLYILQVALKIRHAQLQLTRLSAVSLECTDCADDHCHRRR